IAAPHVRTITTRTCLPEPAQVAGEGSAFFLGSLFLLGVSFPKLKTYYLEPRAALLRRHPHPSRPRPSQSREKLIRLRNIFRNLFFQFLWPRELLLLAQSLPEPHLNPLRRKISRIIQQVRFHAQSRSIKRRPNSHIRHAPVTARLP